MTEFHYATDADGVAFLTWDVPGKSMNVMSFEALAELEAGIDKALADPAVKGVVITSGKKDFAGGMDLNLIAKMKDSAGDDPARGLFEKTLPGCIFVGFQTGKDLGRALASGDMFFNFYEYVVGPVLLQGFVYFTSIPAMRPTCLAQSPPALTTCSARITPLSVRTSHWPSAR